MSDFSVRDLIDEYNVEEGTFDIPLKNGQKIVVRNVVDYRTIVAINKKAAGYRKMAKAGAFPPMWTPYISPGPEPISTHVAEVMAYFTSLIVAPKFEDLDVLEFCHKNGTFAAWLFGKIMERMNNAVPAAELEAFEDEKNDLSPTESGEATSPSAETTSANQ